MSKLTSFVGYLLELRDQRYLRVSETEWYRFIGPSLARQGRDCPLLEAAFKWRQAEDFKLDKDA